MAKSEKRKSSKHLDISLIRLYYLNEKRKDLT